MIEQYVTLSTERRAASTPRVTPTALPLDTCRSWRLISLRLASFKRRVRRSYAHSRALAHKQASQEGTSRCPECGPPSERPLSAAPKPAVGPIHVPIPGTRPCAARHVRQRAPKGPAEGPLALFCTMPSAGNAPRPRYCCRIPCPAARPAGCIWLPRLRGVASCAIKAAPRSGGRGAVFLPLQ